MFIVIVSLCFYQTLTTSQLQFRLVSLDNLPHFFLNIVHTNFVHSHLVIIFILLFIYVLPARVYLLLFLLVVCSLFSIFFLLTFFLRYAFCIPLSIVVPGYWQILRRIPHSPPSGQCRLLIAVVMIIVKGIVGRQFSISTTRTVSVGCRIIRYLHEITWIWRELL